MPGTPGLQGAVQRSESGSRSKRAATKTGGKLELMTETGEFYKTHAIEYTGGARYPVLERGTGADVIADILKPRTPAAGK